LIEVLDLAAALFDGELVHRLPHGEAGLLYQLLVRIGAVADELEVANRGPLDDLIDHDHAVGRLLGVGAHVAKQARA
jgi:hypothetical protein